MPSISDRSSDVKECNNIQNAMFNYADKLNFTLFVLQFPAIWQCSTTDLFMRTRIAFTCRAQHWKVAY